MKIVMLSLFVLLHLFSSKISFVELGGRLQLSDTSKVKWLSDMEYTFPTLTKGARVEHIFYFKNTSHDSLVIDNVRTDCGCTASDWDEKATAVGDTGRVVVQFHARSTGNFKEKIAVWIKGQRKPEKLYIQGNIVDSW
jgi:Protein of unknown function (DUF1573)